ncbi:MAG: hypothetical protein CMP40_02715, partial [Rickettsiales bacterium]|nr:hypothetical protein [Rickettsiales bacterium]
MSLSFYFFCLALTVRVLFIILQGPNLEDKLIEDELMYWNNALYFFEKGSLSEQVYYERMPGIFIFYKLLLSITSKNLQYILIIQALIDTLSCFVIYKISSITLSKYKNYIFFFSAISPLMIIMASQVLTETIFMFCFVLYLYFALKGIEKRNSLFINFFLSGLFLGFSVCIRSISFPLILLSIIPIAIILINKKISIINISLCIVIFLFSSIVPVSKRIVNNLEKFDTFSLTSQTGIHLAYWVTPLVLSETKNLNRKDAIKIIEERKKKYDMQGDIFQNDLILRTIGFEILSEISLIDLTYSWIKGAFINVTAPSLLLDKKVRNLPHPSYYQDPNLKRWTYNLIYNKEYHYYLAFLMLSLISSLFTLSSIIIGPFLLLKENKTIFYLCLLYVLYFLVITGPVLSPKYIYPILPCIFIYQSLTIKYLKD